MCHNTHTLNATTQLCDVMHVDKGMVFIDLLYGVDLSGRDADALATAIRDAVRAHFTNYNASDIHVTSMHSSEGATIFNLTIPLADFSAHDQEAAVAKARTFLDVTLDFTQFARLFPAHNPSAVETISLETHDAEGLVFSSAVSQPTHEPLGEKEDDADAVIWWALGGAGLFIVVLMLIVVVYNCTGRARTESSPPNPTSTVGEYARMYFT